MTFIEFISYFETVAINNKVLAHAPNAPIKRITFYEIDIDTILNAVRLDLKYTSMLIECPEFKPDDGKSDNIRDMSTSAFLIVKEVIIGDIVSRRNALDETLTVARQVVSKMLNDSKKARLNMANSIMKDFDVNTARFFKVGPICNNLYGYRVEFTLNQRFSKNLQLDESEWDNETKYTQ